MAKSSFSSKKTRAAFLFFELYTEKALQNISSMISLFLVSQVIVKNYLGVNIAGWSSW